jgi:hypothetical protein
VTFVQVLCGHLPLRRKIFNLSGRTGMQQLQPPGPEA